jgi:8-oxo-dGTP pyrophosphatase MutT (NUDIX family)
MIKSAKSSAPMTFDAPSTEQTTIKQAGAICYQKRDGKLSVLLIGSRRHGRWGIPKGTIEIGETSWKAAVREAFEEAGVNGKCARQQLGSFIYLKDGRDTHYEVRVHLLKVSSMASDFPEKGQRSMAWVTIDEAVNLVWNAELHDILRNFATEQLVVS